MYYHTWLEALPDAQGAPVVDMLCHRSKCAPSQTQEPRGHPVAAFLDTEEDCVKLIWHSSVEGPFL